MSIDFEDRLGGLEARIKRLEYREGQILQLVDSHNAPFALFVLQYDLDAEQVEGICEVMEYAHNTLSTDAPIDEMDFEKRLLPYIPPKERASAYLFVQGVMASFCRSGQYNYLYEHLKPKFNLPRLEWTKD